MVVAFNEHRFGNIERIIQALMRICFVTEVIVWNNNENVRYVDNVGGASFVKVINSPENIGTMARYKACTHSSSRSCYMIDDDWLPIHLHMLYYIHLRHDSSETVVLTNAVTQFMDYTYTFHENARHFGFAWLGVGSIVPKSHAHKFISLAHLIDEEFSKHEDIFFTLFSDVPPIVISAKIQDLNGNTHDHGMSSEPGYLEFQMKAFNAAFKTVSNDARNFPPNVERAKRWEDVRAICPDGRKYVTSNILPVYATQKKKCAISECNFELDGTSQTRFAHSSYEAICDNSGQCAFMNMLLTNSYIGYEFVEPVGASSLRVVVKGVFNVDAAFSVEAVHSESNNFESVPHQLRMRRRARSIIRSSEAHDVLEFVFERIQRVRAIRLVALRDVRASLCDVQVNTAGENESESKRDRSDTNDELVLEYEPETSKEAVNLTIAITSAVENHSHRQAIRKTLALWSAEFSGVSVRFFIGSSNDTVPEIEKENAVYKDIIQQTIAEGYDALTVRTLMIFEWVVRNASETNFLLKMDDDTFVQLEQIVAFLRTVTREESLYMGHFFYEQEVYRSPLEKNYEPLYEGSLYPPYASGSGYVLSINLVQFILRSWKEPQSLRIFRNEDVSVGIWLLALNDVRRLHRDDFWPEPPAECKEDAVLVHRVDPLQMLKYYKNLRTSGCMCSTSKAACHKI